MTTCTSRSLCLACSIQRTKCRSRCWQPLGTCKPHCSTSSSNHRSRHLHKPQYPNRPNTSSDWFRICFLLRSRQFFRLPNRTLRACKPLTSHRPSTMDCQGLWRLYRRRYTSRGCRLFCTRSKRRRFQTSWMLPTRDKQHHTVLVLNLLHTNRDYRRYVHTA